MVAGILIILLVASVALYAVYGRAGGTVQTSTVVAYSIEIDPLNGSVSTTAGSTIVVLFNVTSPRVGPLYFYARAIAEPGSLTNFSLQNVTAGDIQLPPGVAVSYPTGQAVFGTNHTILTLRIAFSPTVNGTVGMIVGVFQQVDQVQVVGSGIGFYVYVRQQ